MRIGILNFHDNARILIKFVYCLLLATKNTTRNHQNGIIVTSRVSVTQMEVDGAITIEMGRIANERTPTKIITAVNIRRRETAAVIITKRGDKKI